MSWLPAWGETPAKLRRDIQAAKAEAAAGRTENPCR